MIPHRRRRLRRAFAFAVTMIAALTATLPQAGAGDDGEPIKIGIYAPVAGNAAGISFPYSVSAAEAAVRAINEEGGVKDRPFELVHCDPEENPNEAGACARQFVDEQVVAVVGSFSTQGASAIVPVLEEAGIPNVGVYPVSGADLQSSVSFPFIGGSVPVFAGAPFFFEEEGIETVYALHIDNASAAAVAGFVERGTEAAGLEFVGSAGIPATVADMAPYVSAAQDAGAEGVVLALSEPGAVQFIQAAEAGGADFTFAYVGFTPENLEALGEAAEGVVVPSPIPPDTKATRRAFPEMRQYHKDMRAQARTGDEFARIANTQLPHTQRAWSAVYELAEVIEAIPGEEVTAATVLTQLGATAEFDTGFGEAFTIPGSVATFPRIGNFWVYNAVVRDGKHVLVEDEPIDMAELVFSEQTP